MRLFAVFAAIIGFFGCMAKKPEVDDGTWMAYEEDICFCPKWTKWVNFQNMIVSGYNEIRILIGGKGI